MGSSDPASSRRALLGEIIAHGITHADARRSIRCRNGTHELSWIMSFLGVGLREPWLSRACDLLLEMLEDFEARQIATMGMAASSLLAGCVLRSGGACNALLVRPEPKAHGSGKQIEGLPDRRAPVVIIDDAVGSGYSALRCAEILEAEGFEVEGVICLVRFGYDGGYGLLEERGFRVRALYDVHDDLTPAMAPGGAPPANPWRARDIRWRDETAPDGLPPFALARRFLREAREHGALSRPPARLAIELAAPGGLWISARRRDSGAPAARIGVWRFEDEPQASMPALLAEACWFLATHWPQDPHEQESLGLGLSLFGPLTPCAPGQAGNDTLGLVCRSRERRWQIGSALPAMPGFAGTAHQLRHALFGNGGIRPREGFDLYSATVTKLIEPGARWPQGGCTARPHPEPQARDAMARVLLDRIRAIITGAEAADEQAPFLFDADFLFVSIYRDDALCACLGMRCESVETFDLLVRSAMQDPRMQGVDPAAAWVQLSVLSARWSEASPPAFVPGQDALGLEAGGQDHILLPGVAVEENLDAEGFAALLHVKAGSPPEAGLVWSRFAVNQWSAGPDGGGLLSHPSLWVARRSLASENLDEAARGWFDWLSRSLAAGTLSAHELPVQDARGDALCDVLYAETIRRLREAAPALGRAAAPVPYDLLPRDADLLTLAHAHAATGAFGGRLGAALTAASPRLSPIAFWRAQAVLDTPDPRSARWRLAPVAPLERIVRLCARFDAGEADWLAALVDSQGAVIATDTEAEDTLLEARAAEALAGSPRRADRALARRILAALAGRSVALDGGGAAVRASRWQSGLRTEHTIAALAAFARLAGADQ